MVAPCCVRQIYASPIYKHRSAMDLPTKAAWPVRRYVVFRCRGFSPLTLYIRKRVLRSLESPLPLCIYRIAYFPQKNNRQDIRIPTFGFALIYKLFLFVLYVLTNRLHVWYNNSVVGNLLGSGISAMEKPELEALLSAVKPYIPAAELRGVWALKQYNKQRRIYHSHLSELPRRQAAFGEIRTLLYGTGCKRIHWGGNDFGA